MRIPADRGYGVNVDLIPDPATTAGDATRYYPPRWRLLLHALGLGFVLLVLLLPALNANPVMAGISWFLLVLVGIPTAVLVVRALRPGPTVLVDANGITDRTTLAPNGLVRWDQITVIRKKEIGRGMGAERLLEVVLSDPAGFASRRRSWFGRLTDRYRALLRQPAVSIASSMVSAPMSALIAEIRRRQPTLQVLEGPPPRPGKLATVRRAAGYSRGRIGRPGPYQDPPRW